MTNLGLVGYNKRFLCAAVGAPGSTQDAKLLKESSIFHKILKRDVLPDRVTSLGDFGYVPLVTVGDSASPQFSRLIKGYNENTRDKQQRYFNKRLCGARVTTENASGILKGRSLVLYKKQNAAYLIAVMLLWLASHYITYALNWQILVNLDGN